MQLQDIYKTLSDNSCLALCYLYTILDDNANPEEKNPDFLNITLNALLLAAYTNQIGLNKECYVTDADKLMNEAALSMQISKRYKVEKIKVEAIPALPNGYVAVKFESGFNAHWVLYKDRTLLYNSLSNSKCFSYGKPTEGRVIHVQSQ